MNEEWVDISEFKNYQVSNHGRVKRIGGVVRKTTTLRNGYPICSFGKSGKVVVRYVHRLVAIAFIPNPINKREVNHIDSVKTNCHISNLEWVTPKENQQHSHRNGRVGGNLGKFNHKTVSTPVKCDTLDMIFPSLKEAERQLGLPRISKALNGTRKHIQGLTFRYL